MLNINSTTNWTHDTNQFQVNTMSCDAIILRLAIGRDGLDVELNLENFTGLIPVMSQDMTINIASAGEGFNPVLTSC